MATGELLNLEPMELQFPFDLNKQISCTLQLTNKTDSRVAFKVKTTNPKKYCVRPNTGFVLPRSSCDVIVTMQAQKEAPPDLQCKDKFLVQSVAVDSVTSPKDITPEMFSKESGNLVEEFKLRVSYVSPPRSSSPVQKGVEEDLSPGAPALDNGSFNNSEMIFAPRDDNDHEDNSVKEKALVARLTQERDSFVQQNNKLRQELEQLRREAKTSQGGIPLMYVIVVGLIALIFGYIIKKK